ncbi:MAG: hypothetical protein B6244_02020 [Candidatus Cloacimonetes bacterium 4572_55]|nr:MAG: hypothetical protein B6244_02020 [Candidatus Cloacimonetes bacterium 4572_55]
MDNRKRDSKRFHGRQLTSFIITCAFLVIAVTGLVLYIVPSGRVARWTNWMLFGLNKDQWGAVHTIFAFIFIISTAFHIYFNWKTLIGYFKKKVQSQFRYKAEIIASSLFTITFLIITIADLPPSRQIMEISGSIKDSWDVGDIQAPFPHAEEFSVKSLAIEIRMEPEIVINRLQDNGLRGVTPDITIIDLAALNGTSPEKIFGILRKTAPGSKSTGGDGVESVAEIHKTIDNRLPTTGLGRLTLQDTSEKLGIPLERAIELLQKRQIKAAGDDKLKDLAEQINGTPIDVVDILKN